MLKLALSIKSYDNYIPTWLINEPHFLSHYS